MRPFILTPMIEQAIAKVRAHAEANPITLERMQLILAEQAPPPGNDPAFVVQIPMDFRAVFSIDCGPERRVRHLSVSVAAAERVPHPEAIKMLLPLFGFVSPLEECFVWIEKPEKTIPEFSAINISEEIK